MLWLVAVVALPLSSCGKSQDQVAGGKAESWSAEQRGARAGGAEPSGGQPTIPVADPNAAEPVTVTTETSPPGAAVALDGRTGAAPPAQAGQHALTGVGAGGGGLGAANGYGTGAGKGGMARGAMRPPAHPDEGGSESYHDYGVNPWTDTSADKLSTFAVDVDTASYTIARRKLVEGTAPPAAAVRVEEFVNYFKYGYAGPEDGSPFAVHLDAAPSPLSPGKHILRVGIQARRVAVRDRQPAHLVFLVDVSGSMQSPDKLELAKRSLRILVDNLRDGDTVALVTYAGSTRVVLQPTGLERKAEILAAIEDLSAGGSTAMASGIDLAYELAEKTLAPGSVTRVIVLSDGDANVGATTQEDILRTIAGKVKEGVTLTTVGFGMGNYRDDLMEQLADKGNGNNFYIDGISQAKRVFQEQLGGTLEVVAKDVKIQVEMNPDAVARYRLVGYENRDIRDQDFRDDKVDAGEIGAGHTVTALYELELAAKPSGPLATVRVRAKAPRGDKASETAHVLTADHLYARFADAPADMRFAVAVMATAEKLRGSKAAAGWKLPQIRAIAQAASGDVPERQELVALIDRAIALGDRLAQAE